MQFNLPNSTSLSYKQAGRFYIGPTSIGMAKREFNRMAEYRLAKDGTPVHVELAVKYWSRRSDFLILLQFQLLLFQHIKKPGFLNIYWFQDGNHRWTIHSLPKSWRWKHQDGWFSTRNILRLFHLFQRETDCFKDYAEDSPPKVFLHSLQTSSSLEHSFWAHKSRPPFFWYGANPQVWEIWWLGDLCVVPTSVIIWNSQRVVEPENFLHQPWSSEIWRSQNWIVQRPCHFWHTPIFQHKFQDFYAIMSWSTRKLQFRCIFQPQNWGKLQHRHFQVFYIITRSMSTSTLYRIRPSWHVRALNWLPKSKTMILQSIVLVFITTCCCWNPRVEVALQVAHLWNSQRLLYVLSQLCTISEDLAWTIAVLD